jgi:hypothetical protein
MANAIPLILLAGAGLLLMSKKDKKGATATPGGVDEEAFELEDVDEPGGPGPLDDFPAPGGEIDPATAAEPGGSKFVQRPADDPVAKCNRFIEEIWVDVDDDDELPVNEVAVEEAILPALRAHMSAVADSKGSMLKDEDVMPDAALAAMEAVAPGCGWEVVDLAWRYAGNQPVTGKVRDVVVSVMKLVPSVMSQVNQDKGYVFKAHISKIVPDGGGGGVGGLGS